MGECISKNYIKKGQISPSNGIKSDKFEIQLIKNTTDSQIHFQHSPLQTSQFLSQKFSQSAAVPAEVNLTFMVVNVQIDEVRNEVNITYINENQINIYFLLGGQQAINNTGLSIEISKIKYAQKINRKEPSSKQGEKVLIVPSMMSNQPIFILMEPVMKNGQSMFLINRYTYSPGDKHYRRKSQSLQWSSLAFDLQDIYGADNLFKCDASEQCLVCLSSPASVILTPCRHMCMCGDCSNNYGKSSKKCPICRAQFISIIRYN